ncbi:MAG TPA: acetylxylan esterase [Nonomuraea sp.]|nr:acetylxylan esterase [Nonomuraea sp.]
MFVDLPLAQLRAYLPERAEPADFAAFWERTLAATALADDLARAFVDVPFMCHIRHATERRRSRCTRTTGTRAASPRTPWRGSPERGRRSGDGAPPGMCAIG